MLLKLHFLGSVAQKLTELELAPPRASVAGSSGQCYQALFSIPPRTHQPPAPKQVAEASGRLRLGRGALGDALPFGRVGLACGQRPRIT